MRRGSIVIVGRVNPTIFHLAQADIAKEIVHNKGLRSVPDAVNRYVIVGRIR